MTKLLDLTKPVQTRMGRKARIIATDSKVRHMNVEFPIVAMIQISDNTEIVDTFQLDGRITTCPENDGDLVNAPEREFRYFNIHNVDGYNRIFPTLESAQSAGRNLAGWLGTVQVILDDGIPVGVSIIPKP